MCTFRLAWIVDRHYSNVLIFGRNTRSGCLSRTKEIGRTTQLQAEAGILRNVWFGEDEDFTSDGEV